MRSSVIVAERSIGGKKFCENPYPPSSIMAYFSNTSWPHPVMTYLSNTYASYPQTLLMAQAWQAFPAQHQEPLRQSYCIVAYTLEQNQVPTTREFEQFILADPNSGYLTCCFHNCHRHFHHTRRQRAIAHIRRHFGHRPYACDGVCGVTAWCVPIRHSEKS